MHLWLRSSFGWLSARRGWFATGFILAVVHGVARLSDSSTHWLEWETYAALLLWALLIGVLMAWLLPAVIALEDRLRGHSARDPSQPPAASRSRTATESLPRVPD